ncbi:MAG: DUF5058 family protein [Solobacterium sp.]|nr:DUF5058 family protein [Clostridia bacterium]MBQ6531518.1 DUF5058 family protein [Solobacterium sp.]MBR0213468.1 DUF5058 family protein [Solobacterium sp.]
MSDELRAFATSPLLWIIAALTVSIVILQALLFRRRAVAYTREHGILTEEEIKTVTRNGAISAIGPALAVFILAITISGLLGGPFVLMRVGIIGSADTELRTATAAALISGKTLGVDPIDMSTFGTIFFTCAFMSCGYLIWVPIMTRGLGKSLQKFLMPDPNEEQTKAQKIVGGLLMVLPLAMIGLMIFMYASSGPAFILVMATAAILKVVLDKLSANAPALKSWALGLAVLVSMLSSIVWNMMF